MSDLTSTRRHRRDVRRPAGRAAARPEGGDQPQPRRSARLAQAGRAKFDAALEAAYGEQARAARLEAGKDFGVVHLKDGLLRVTVDVPKRVSWDQAQLAAIARRIAAAGENEDYLDVEFSVSESHG
jgi:hypothetical protein